MSWKGLVIEQPARLSLRLGQLVLERQDGEHRIPLEDLSFMVLDTAQATLTAALLSACAESGCMVLTTDARHLPNGVLQSFPTHHRQLETLYLQTDAGEPRKKRLWQGLVQHKIANQADCLRALGLPGARAVSALARKVRSGDPDNVEGQAARLYWSKMGEGFHRDSEGGDRLNALLNYGYALVRSALAQALAAHGFIPALGLHHRSRQNPFNLADDMLEPWRPLVDCRAVNRRRATGDVDGLTSEDRKHMLGIFFDQVQWQGGVQSVLSALRPYVEQLRVCLGAAQGMLACPSFTHAAPAGGRDGHAG